MYNSECKGTDLAIIWIFKSSTSTNHFSFIFEGFKVDDEFDQEDSFSTSVQSRKANKKAPQEKTELKTDELVAHFRELWTHDARLLKHLFPSLNEETM
jgi:hypothetical protein